MCRYPSLSRPFSRSLDASSKRSSRLILVGLGFSISALVAQTEATPLDHLEITLQPEYDRPAMLVIYRFALANDMPLPATVTLPIPEQAGSPHAVAWMADDGLLYNAGFSQENAGAWSLVSIDMEESRNGQLEYYADLAIEGQRRNYQFEWPGGVELGGLSYQVQQPAGASSLRVVPLPDREALGPEGLNHLFAQLGPLGTNNALTIDVSYEKIDPGLTIEELSPPEQLIVPSIDQSEPLILSPLLLVGAGILLLGGGALYFFRSRAPRAAPIRRRRRAKPKPPESVIDASAVFCHQCGTRAQVSDTFCRHCGTQLRKRPDSS